MPRYSVIVPVYNRPDEMAEMLDSLNSQTYRDFEVVVVEDGSDKKSEDLMGQYNLDIHYYFKSNTGPGDSRNFGMEKAKGDYLMFFDSDCVLPPDYFENLEEALSIQKYDAFGGPDGAHHSFTIVQKAINYSMTSFMTTGGIRGGRQRLDRYQPRSFNMGLTREVYEKVGGFSDIHPGEDPDLSFRILSAGFKVGYVERALVYHKRRISFKKFAIQVYKFGVVRVVLNKWHPGTGRLVYTLPTIFLLGLIALIGCSFFYIKASYLIALYAMFVFLGALVTQNTIQVSLLAVPAAFVQLTCYGWGFLKSFVVLRIFGRHEREAFPSFFFGKK